MTLLGLRRWTGASWLAVAAVLFGAPATQAQAANPASPAAEVTFAFERPGMPVPQYVLTVHEDGSAHYAAKGVAAPISQRYGVEAASSATGEVQQNMHLSAPAVQRIFATARADHFFTGQCNSRAKNLADTGRKTLSYRGPDGSGSCVYNYSDNKGVSNLTQLFLGIQQTLEEGRRLEWRHRYDRLGLDAEMETLQTEAAAGQALELGTIAPVLESISRDTDLIERVRVRAARLLERTQATPPEAQDRPRGGQQSRSA